MTKPLQFERMHPGELEQLVRERPLAWVPVGALEWHGRHLPVGLDPIKAHALCLRCAERAGGVVMPPHYVSILGLFFPWTFKYSPATFSSVINGTLRALHGNGFKVIFLITGHYPVEQVALLMALAEAFMATHDVVVVAVPEFAFAHDCGYNGDHAAMWETSLIMELCPELVDRRELARLAGRRGFALMRRGVYGRNPAEAASRERGAGAVEEIVENAGALADELLASRDKSRARRVHRESSLSFVRGEFAGIMKSLSALAR